MDDVLLYYNYLSNNKNFKINLPSYKHTMTLYMYVFRLLLEISVYYKLKMSCYIGAIDQGTNSSRFLVSSYMLP